MTRVFMSLIISLMLVSSLGSAQPREHMKEMMSHRKEMRGAFMDDLKLNDEQMTKMKKLRFDLEKKQIQTGSRIRLARLDLKELFGVDKLDRAAIEKQVRIISDLQQEQKLNQIDHMFAVNALLTSDQQKIWREHMGHMGEEAREHMMKRGGMEREHSMKHEEEDH